MNTPQDFIDAYVAAFEAGDREAMLALYADDFQAFDALDEVEFRDKDAWAGRIAAWFSEFGGERRCEFVDAEVHETDDMSVIVTTLVHSGEIDGLDEEAIIEIRATFVLGRIDGKLQVVHEHTSVPMAVGEVVDDMDFEYEDEGREQEIPDHDDVPEKVVGDEEDLDVEGKGHRGGMNDGDDDRPTEAMNQ